MGAIILDGRTPCLAIGEECVSPNSNLILILVSLNCFSPLYRSYPLHFLKRGPGTQLMPINSLRQRNVRVIQAGFMCCLDIRKVFCLRDYQYIPYTMVKQF